MNSFELAEAEIKSVIATSEVAIDPSHAENTVSWLRSIAPDADEILQLAALAHDIERSAVDKLRREDFADYNEYKRKHARRGGQIAATIALKAGYTEREAARLAELIEAAEFSSDNPQVQLICDADSISFFDNNAAYYLQKNGKDRTIAKMRFMHDRASAKAQGIIKGILKGKPELNLLGLN